MESDENEIEVPLHDSQKFLRTLAVICIGVAGLPLMGGAILLASADPQPPGTPWLQHNLTAALLLAGGILLDTVGGFIIVASLNPFRADRWAEQIRRVIGGGPGDHMNPPH